MATTTATLTLSSADLTGDALSLSTTATLTKAGTTTTSATTQYTLFDGSDYTNDKAHKVYIKNTSTTATEYVTVEINSEAVGRLYAGDWMFFPWGANAATNDIKLAPSVSTTFTVEYMIISEV